MFLGATGSSGWSEAYLVRKGKRQLDLVRGDIGVTSTGQGSGESGGTSPEGGAGDTE